METELKLEVMAGNASQILRSPVLSRLLPQPPDADELVSTYFDTPDLYLRQNGASLRVRDKAGERVQTLKLDRAVTAGLFERDEFEGPVQMDTPDLASLTQLVPQNSKAMTLLAANRLAERLQRQFVTRINRCAAAIELSDDTTIELAFDDGVVEAEAGPSADIHGIEMELKSGASDELFSLALELLNDVPLRIDHLSKADRGFNLLVQEHSAPVRAAPLKLSKTQTVEAAFQAVARNCLAQIHGNERGVTSGHDPSSVHQMRVGLRRLRSALDLFAPVISTPGKFDGELRWIAGELGKARDWEVLSGSTLEQVFGSVTDDTDALTVRQTAKDIATQNRQSAVTAVDSVRYTRLIIEFTLWIESMGWREDQTDKDREALGKPVLKFASKTLMRRHKRLLKRGGGLAGLDNETRHRARIAAKKVRYATEFFASMFPRRAVKHYVNALSALQDDLGWRNDVVVADGLLRSLAASKTTTALAAGFARGYFASRAEQDHDSLRKLWKRFSRLTPPQC